MSYKRLDTGEGHLVITDKRHSAMTIVYEQSFQDAL